MWRSVALRSVLRLLQHRVEHLADELLLRLGQAMDLLQLLFELGGRPTLAPGFGALRADERLHRGVQVLGELRQRLDRNPHGAAFVVGHGLLGDAQHLGQLHLGDALGNQRGRR